MNLLERLEASAAYQRVRARMNQGLVRFFEWQVLRDRRGLRVAEVACGSGLAAHLLAGKEQVALSVAADLNLEDYRQAAMDGFQAAFVLMDIFRPALAAASMDLVWNSSSLEELDDPGKALQAMVQLAKPGGFVFVGVPNRYGIAGLISVIPHSALRTWLGRTYRANELRDLLEGQGLIIQQELSYLFGTFVGALAIKPAGRPTTPPHSQ